MGVKNLYDLFVEETCDEDGQVDNNYFDIWLKNRVNKYIVKYIDNTGNGDSIDEYDTKEEAENAIEKELENVKEWMNDYDYGDFGGEFGLKTEIWSIDGNEYACWERLYE